MMNSLLMLMASTMSGLIGRDMKLPWNLPEDLKRFRKITGNGTLIMGSKTFKSIKKPLKGRHSVVLTSNLALLSQNKEEVTFSRTPEEAMACAEKIGEKIFVIGGAEIYRLFQKRVSTLHWTKILDNTITGDTYFPIQNLVDRMVCKKQSQLFPAINQHPAYQFLEYQKIA